MRFRPSLIYLVGTAALFTAAAASCTTRANYLDREGPRFAASRAPWTRALEDSAPSESFKVVSYNVRYGEELDLAIRTLAETPELADADVILLQEMDAPGVDRVARALGYSYVYYPASLRTWGRDFGNAVLTRGRIVDDGKVLLPHLHPVNRQQRIAVRTDLELDGQELSAYSVHTEMPFLSLASRAEQIEVLLSSVLDGSRPCLIAGDFNTMGKRSLECFESAFACRGFQRATVGLGSTFEYGPFSYALDHVFVRGLEVVNAGKVEGAGASDHIPIWVELARPEDA